MVEIVPQHSKIEEVKMDPRNPIVYMDVKIDDEKVGRIIIELFASVVPKTAENFLALCVGSHYSSTSGKKLHYKGAIFHKAIPGLFIQGGDVTNFDGTAGESIFGSPFEDENYVLQHDSPGILSAVNSGQNSNNSQFIITVGKCPHLDGSSVVFGKVLKGLACAIEISEVKTEDDKPVVKCLIESCGELLLNDPWNFVDDDETEDAFPPDPRDLTLQSCQLSDMLNVLNIIKKSGNYFFSKGNYVEANRKYKKGIRYIQFWISLFNVKLDTNRKNELYTELEKAKMSLMLNSAAVALKKGLFRHTLNLCNEIVRKEKSNAKAYFRRGIALKYLNDFEGALQEQKKALSLAPHDKCIKDEINEIYDMKRKYLLQEKKVFSRMFNQYK